MEQIVTKAVLLGRLHDAYMQFQDGIAQLTTTQIGTPNTIRDWSIKDLVAHLIAHEQRALQELRAAIQGEAFVIDHAANDSFNAGAVAASRPYITDAILRAWHQSFHEVIASIEALPDEAFHAPHPITDILDDTIDGAIANNTYAHYQEHLADIERVIEQLRT